MTPSGLAGVGRLHHVGVVVDDLAAAREFLGVAFGLDVAHEVDASEFRAAFLPCGDISIELIEPIGDDARHRRLGPDRQAQIEHIALEVGNLQRAVGALDELGVETTGPARPGPGYRSVWTVPASSDGVMYQLLELDPRAAPPPVSA